MDLEHILLRKVSQTGRKIKLHDLTCGIQTGDSIETESRMVAAGDGEVGSRGQSCGCVGRLSLGTWPGLS